MTPATALSKACVFNADVAVDPMVVGGSVPIRDQTPEHVIDTLPTRCESAKECTAPRGTQTARGSFDACRIDLVSTRLSQIGSWRSTMAWFLQPIRQESEITGDGADAAAVWAHNQQTDVHPLPRQSGSLTA